MHSYISVLNVVRFMWGLSEETQLALENKTMKKVMPFGLREFWTDMDQYGFVKLRPDTAIGSQYV